jgi:hypothetical protein
MDTEIFGKANAEFDALPPDAQRKTAALTMSVLGQFENSFVGKFFRRAMEGMGYSAATTSLAEEIAERHGGTLEDVFSKALTLYEVALDAEAEGNHLAVISPHDDIVHDIVNIKPQSTEPVSTSSATPAGS